MVALRQGRDEEDHICVIEDHSAQVDGLTLSVLVKLGEGRRISYWRQNEGWATGLEEVMGRG